MTEHPFIQYIKEDLGYVINNNKINNFISSLNIGELEGHLSKQDIIGIYNYVNMNITTKLLNDDEVVNIKIDDKIKENSIYKNLEGIIYLYKTNLIKTAFILLTRFSIYNYYKENTNIYELSDVTKQYIIYLNSIITVDILSELNSTELQDKDKTQSLILKSMDNVMFFSLLYDLWPMEKDVSYSTIKEEYNFLDNIIKDNEGLNKILERLYKRIGSYLSENKSLGIILYHIANKVRNIDEPIFKDYYQLMGQIIGHMTENAVYDLTPGYSINSRSNSYM